MDKLKITKLFADLCCSECKHDFTEESISIIRQEHGLYVVQVTCEHCNKTFGLAFLGLESITLKPAEVEDEYLRLTIQEGPATITEDDVLDAHRFIQNMDSDWSKYIPEEFKN